MRLSDFFPKIGKWLALQLYKYKKLTYSNLSLKQWISY